MLEQNAENDSLGLSYIGRPSHVFQNTIIWQPVSNINYTVGVRHVRGLEDFGGVDQPNYTVIRTAVQWVVIKNVTVFARVENVADINYAEVPGFTANPLGLYLGLKWVL
jgi:outer membrane receptor protein involved in Fe transport